MLNYFDLFDLPVDYVINEGELTTRYLKKQRSLEGGLSSQLNTAYAILKDPLQRAEYVLSLQGKNVDAMPKNLAVKMFELRESFENSSCKEDFIKKLKMEVDNLLISLNNYRSEESIFFEIFCKAKFVHSFLEKVQNAYDRD